VLPAHPVKPTVNDSGFDEGTPSRSVERQPVAVPPPEPSPITLTASGSTFAFPRPLPRSLSNISTASSSRDSDAVFRSAIPPDSDWTTQLDRLREISETSLVVGVEHPSHFGSVDTSANETLGEFLLSIAGEAAGGTARAARARYAEDFRSGIYPMRGLYGLAQPSMALPVVSVSPSIDARAAEPVSDPQETVAAASTTSTTPTLAYPSLVLYPPVYPTFNLYPRSAASSSPASSIREPSPRSVPQAVALVLDDPTSWANEPATPSGYVDDDPFASSSFSPDSPTSPVPDGSGSDGLDDFLESYTHQGRPLSSITEVTENVTSGSTSRTWSGNFTPAVETPGGRFGELELEEGEDAQWATEVRPSALSLATPLRDASLTLPVQPVALPRILLDAAAGPPRFTYSSPTASIEPTALEPADLAHSPLPSPTIRPASALSDSLPLIPHVPIQPPSDGSDEELDATAHDDDDYTLDLTSTLSSTLDYSGSFDSPYIVSPGLQAAFGLDDSPQLGPVLFGDEREYEVHAAAGGDSEEDSQSEDGSQYSGRRLCTRADEDERDPGDQCLTLDRFVRRLSPALSLARSDLADSLHLLQTLSHFEPVLPALFSFPPLKSSRELLDALAQFIVEGASPSSLPASPCAATESSHSQRKCSRSTVEALSASRSAVERCPSYSHRRSFSTSASSGTSGALPSSSSLFPVTVEQELTHDTCREIFFARDGTSSPAADQAPVTQRFVDELFSRVPVGSGKVHVFVDGAGVAQEYEEQLARVFQPDEGEVPRFDLILLGAADLGASLPLFPLSRGRSR